MRRRIALCWAAIVFFNLTSQCEQITPNQRTADAQTPDRYQLRLNQYCECRDCSSTISVGPQHATCGGLESLRA